MNTLPKDVINVILSLSPVESILSLSQVNKYYNTICNTICNNNNFWKQRLCHDYSIIIKDDQDNSMNWKNEYFDILRNKIRYKSMYYHNLYIGYICIINNDIITDTFNRLIKLVESYLNKKTDIVIIWVLDENNKRIKNWMALNGVMVCFNQYIAEYVNMNDKDIWTGNGFEIEC